MLEIHIRGSTHGTSRTATAWCSISIRAAASNGRSCRCGARGARAAGELKLESFVKLSGGKGMHVVLPIERRRLGRRPRTFAADDRRWQMAADNPELYVAKMTKSLRDGRIFIDYLRNSREATSVAPYSTRARAGAPVSAPVAWDELGRTTGRRAVHGAQSAEAARAAKTRPVGQIGRVKQNLPDVKRARKIG